MATIFPTSKIEEMKEQGVNKHLIDLVSMDQNAFAILVAKNIENGTIYKHFFADGLSDFRYAFAAELISKTDADFLNKLRKELEETEESGGTYTPPAQ